MGLENLNGWTVFTKPWPALELGALAGHVRELGFDGVELPVRPGFQVTPETVSERLPVAISVLAAEGLRIGSVAADPTPEVVRACGSAGVPIIRVCIPVEGGVPYLRRETEVRSLLDGLLVDLEKCHVRLGIQNHYGPNVANAMGVRHLIEGYDPGLVGAVWDGAHCGLDGERPEQAADILWSHLCLVNLKNARWEPAGSDAFGASQWEASFVPGPEGLCSWPDVLLQLSRRNYSGDICLTAEYSDHVRTDDYVRRDLAWARSVAATIGSSPAAVTGNGN